MAFNMGLIYGEHAHTSSVSSWLESPRAVIGNRLNEIEDWSAKRLKISKDCKDCIGMELRCLGAAKAFSDSWNQEQSALARGFQLKWVEFNQELESMLSVTMRFAEAVATSCSDWGEKKKKRLLEHLLRIYGRSEQEVNNDK